MPWLLKRILTNGLAAAAALAVLGLGFTELAGVWLSVGVKSPAAAEATAPVADAIRSRVPLTMAAWGFGFVAISEVLLFVFRGGPPGAKKRVAKEPKAETAEVLLDELLRQTEEAQKQKAEARGPKPDETGTSPSLSIHP